MSRRISTYLRQHHIGLLALFLAMSGGTAYALDGENTVFSDDIVDREVRSPDIAAQAVATGHLRADAVNGAKVADGSLTDADLSTTAKVPSGAVVFMSSAACPAGWSPFAAARGRYVVGLVPGGTPRATVGTALGAQENRAVGRHAHAITDPGHDHAFTDSGTGFAGFGGTTFGSGGSFGPNAIADQTESATTGVQVRPAGGVSGTNAPYVQLQACEKD